MRRVTRVLAFEAGVERKLGLMTTTEFPPTDPVLVRVMEANGAALEPSPEARVRGYELLLGYEVTSREPVVIAGARVVYDDAGTEREVFSPRPVHCLPERWPRVVQ